MPHWTLARAQALYQLPFMELLYQAQTIHRAHHDPRQIQISTLLSIKTGACPEDCKYCPQSARYHTGVAREALLKIDEITAAAERARDQGATRFCMGAAWRDPKEKDMPYLVEVVRRVKALGLETCMTLGMLDENKAQTLADAGLDYYNHNLDTSRRYYREIITTRNYDDRLHTLDNVRKAGMKICSGGILGMGEAEDDRLAMLVELANLNPPPESVPINQLVRVKGTPLAHADDLEPFDFIRVIAVARILMPKSAVRRLQTADHAESGRRPRRRAVCQTRPQSANARSQRTRAANSCGRHVLPDEKTRGAGGRDGVLKPVCGLWV